MRLVALSIEWVLLDQLLVSLNTKEHIGLFTMQNAILMFFGWIISCFAFSVVQLFM